jgi:hypothetical protein
MLDTSSEALVDDASCGAFGELHVPSCPFWALVFLHPPRLSSPKALPCNLPPEFDIPDSLQLANQVIQTARSSNPLVQPPSQQPPRILPSILTLSQAQQL